MIPVLKFLHIAGLACWCAALIALPLLMQAHGRATDQRQYDRYRLITHLGYTAFATPAGVVTIIAGTMLIFAAQVFEPWLVAKLAFVAGMVLVHVWLGHLIQRSGEEKRSHWFSWPMIALVAVLPLMMIVLALVLLKPGLGWIETLIPDQFFSPRSSAS